jgi:hypothetical protein
MSARTPQLAVLARLQALSDITCLPGSPLAYPFPRTLRSRLSAYGMRQWESLAEMGYEVHIRRPGLQEPQNLMLADVVSPDTYQRWAPTWTRKCATADAPHQALWKVSDVTLPNGLGMRDLSAGNPKWFAVLSRALRPPASLPAQIDDAAALASLTPNDWIVGLDCTLHTTGNVVCFWRPTESAAIALRVYIVLEPLPHDEVLVEELAPDQASHWHKSKTALPNPTRGSLRDVGHCPGRSTAPKPNTYAFPQASLIPFVGDWLRGVHETHPSNSFSVPHSAAWLKERYDTEYHRRHEAQEVHAAGNTHPLRRHLAMLTAPSDPVPEAYRPVPNHREHPNSTDPGLQESEPTLSVCCSGTAITDSSPTRLGAAVCWQASPGSTPACLVGLQTRAIIPSDPARPTKHVSTVAHLSAAALALRVVCTQRVKPQPASVLTDSKTIFNAIARASLQPLGRRRLTATHDTASHNQITAYGHLQRLPGTSLPAVSPTSSSSAEACKAPALRYSQDTACRTAFLDHLPSVLQRFPPGTDWAVFEHRSSAATTSERVIGAIRQHVLTTAALSRARAWRVKPSQGELPRLLTMAGLASVRRTALAQRGPVHRGLIKFAFCSLTQTLPTNERLHRGDPIRTLCRLPNCAGPSQTHAHLFSGECPALLPEFSVIKQCLRTFLESAGPPSWWLALVPGLPVSNKEEAEVEAVEAFASPDIASISSPSAPHTASTILLRVSQTTVTQNPLPIIFSLDARLCPKPPSLPPKHASPIELTDWLRTEAHCGHHWMQLSGPVFWSAIFRWRNFGPDETVSSDVLQAICAHLQHLAQPPSTPATWQALAAATADPILDALSLGAIAGCPAELAPRRTPRVLIPPNTHASSLSRLTGCEDWTDAALEKLALSCGLLVLLPEMPHKRTTRGSGSVPTAYAHLCNLPRKAGTRATLLVPIVPSNTNQHTATCDLITAGYKAIVALPSGILRTLSHHTTTHFYAGSPLDKPYLLLSSWIPTPTQTATLLAALHAFQALLNPTKHPPPLRVVAVPWNSSTLEPQNLPNAQILLLSQPQHANDTQAALTELQQIPVEEYLLPTLRSSNPAPPTGPSTPAQSESSERYAGAALDDMTLCSTPSTHCSNLRCITWPSIAAGIIPAALKHRIDPWIRAVCGWHPPMNSANHQRSSRAYVQLTYLTISAARNLWERRRRLERQITHPSSAESDAGSCSPG